MHVKQHDRQPHSLREGFEGVEQSLRLNAGQRDTLGAGRFAGNPTARFVAVIDEGAALEPAPSQSVTAKIATHREGPRAERSLLGVELVDRGDDSLERLLGRVMCVGRTRDKTANIVNRAAMFAQECFEGSTIPTRRPLLE